MARSAEDLVSDRAMAEAENMVNVAMQDADGQNDQYDLGVALQRLTVVKDVVLRISQAIMGWSELRFEEQRESLGKLLISLLGFFLMCDFCCIRACGKALEAPLARAAELGGAVDKDIKHMDEYLACLRSLRGIALRLFSSTGQATDQFINEARPFEQLLTNTFPLLLQKRRIKYMQWRFAALLIACKASSLCSTASHAQSRSSWTPAARSPMTPRAPST